MNQFKISAHATGSFKYVGLNVVQTSEGVFIDQQAFIQSLTPITISSERLTEKDDLLTSEEKSLLRSVDSCCGRHRRPGQIVPITPVWSVIMEKSPQFGML